MAKKTENIFRLPVDTGRPIAEYELAGGSLLPLDQIKTIIEQKIGFQLELLDDEQVQIQQGDNAQAMATFVYSRWIQEREQLREKFRGKSWTLNKVFERQLPNITPTVTRALHIKLLFRDVVPVKVETHEHGKTITKKANIPIKREREVYFFEDTNHSVSCFSDEYGMPILTPTTYQAMKKAELVASWEVAEVLDEIYKTGRVLSPQKFEEQLDTQEKIARTNNLDFSLAKQRLTQEYSTGYLDRYAISCIGTGILHPQHAQKMLQEVFSQQDETAKQTYYSDYAQLILQGRGQELLLLEKGERIKLVPLYAHAIVEAYTLSNGSSLELIQLCLHNILEYISLLHIPTHLPPPIDPLPEYYNELTDMALTLNKAQRGILCTIAVPSASNRVLIEQAWDCESQLHEPCSLEQDNRRREQYLRGYPTHEFMYTGETITAIRKLSPRDPKPSTESLRDSAASALLTSPIVYGEYIDNAQLDNTLHDGETYTYTIKNGYQSSTYYGHILELFANPRSVGDFSSINNFPLLIDQLIQALSNPNVIKQCKRDEWEYLMSFVYWVQTSIQRIIHSEGNIEKTLHAWMKKLIESICGDKELNYISHNILIVLLAYHQQTGMLQRIRSLGYTLVDTQPLPGYNPYITLAGDEQPFHLACIQASQAFTDIMWKMNFVLRATPPTGDKDEFTAVRHLVRIAGANNQAVCRRYAYINNESVRQEWPMPQRHIQRVQQFVQEHNMTEWDKDGQEPHEQHSRRNSQAVAVFMREELTTLNSLLEEILSQRSRGICSHELVDQFVEEAEFFTNVYCFDGTQGSLPHIQEVDHFAESVQKLASMMKNLARPTSTEHIESITITQQSPLVVLGQNMSGKSTLLRTVAWNAVLQRRGISTFGHQQSSIASIGSLNGRGLQTNSGSLFVNQLRDINDALNHDADLLFADEPFRQTSSTYALLLTAGTLVSEAINPKRKRIMMVACNQPEIRIFNPLFNELGIHPHYVVMHPDTGLHPLHPDQSIEDISLPAVQKHLPRRIVKKYWHDETKSAKTKEIKPIARQDAHQQNLDDIFAPLKEKGTHLEEDRVRAVSYAFGANPRIGSAIYNMFITSTRGEHAQHVFTALEHMPHLKRSSESITQFEEILNIIKTTNPLDRYQALTQYRQKLINKQEEPRNDADVLTPYFEDFIQVITFLSDIPALQGYIDFRVLPKTQEELDQVIQKHIAKENDRYDSAFEQELTKCAAILHLTQFFIQHRFRQSTFTDERKIVATDCWNPLLPKAKRDNDEIVTNTYEIDFEESAAGTVKCGEHHSGKTNNLRGDEAASLLFAQCFGWSTGRITLPRDFLLLSKTQPAYDTQTQSGMDRELETRIVPTLATLAYAKQHPSTCVLACVDEPGVRTSPDDARKLLLMMYQEFAKQTNAKLHTTTHIDHLCADLKELGVETHAQGFVFADPEQRYKVQENQTDGKALEIAALFHFDPWVLRVTEILQQYMTELQTCVNSISPERVNAYARAIRGQRDMFFS